ncbi:Transmembrane protein 68 [Collichthys lucidus]|uniref:Transmembrane protein 68 n=1 Tax=Collichthys lucidus TaxID=240159 RepID=A0A4U5UN51_COLLU|nr:Transmembrane protein 68 [Collichthys lucidus]
MSDSGNQSCLMGAEDTFSLLFYLDSQVSQTICCLPRRVEDELFIICEHLQLCWIGTLKFDRKNQLREAYSNNLWDGARKTLATLWDGHGAIWHGFKLLLEVFSVIHGPQEECVRALRNGHLLGISPGGVREALFSDETYPLLWGKRKGFAQVAIDSQPVIPMFTQNVREGFRSLGTLTPVYGGFPVKFRTFLGDPIPYDPDISAAELAEKVQQAVQSLIDQHQRIPGNILRALLERFHTKHKDHAPRPRRVARAGTGPRTKRRQGSAAMLATHPTRLETRTKESNAHASQRVRRKPRGAMGAPVLRQPFAVVVLGDRLCGPGRPAVCGPPFLVAWRVPFGLFDLWVHFGTRGYLDVQPPGKPRCPGSRLLSWSRETGCIPQHWPPRGALGGSQGLYDFMKNVVMLANEGSLRGKGLAEI